VALAKDVAARFVSWRSWRWQTILLLANAGSILLIAILIDFTGGFPSQLAHLYYLPVVLSALTLSPRWSLAVAVLAALCVSPAIDLVLDLFGRPGYFSNPEPWNLSPSGWVLRPLAFLAISTLGSRFTRERHETAHQRFLSETRAQELDVLSHIDKMIIAGAGEEESVRQISQFIMQLTGAHIAGIATPNPTNRREVTFRGYYNTGSEPVYRVHEHLPYGEGVSGWAMVHGRTSFTRNVLEDSRYYRMAEVARKNGWLASAAAAIVLDGEIMGTLIVGYDKEHDYTPEELAVLERLADEAAIAVANARQRDSLRSMALDTATVLSSVIETRDPYTADHCARIVNYAELACRALDLSARDIDLVKLGAALHDVGKVLVPDSILKKPGPLTPDEYAVMKQHCYFGGQICKKVPFLEPVHGIVYHHHEHFNGLGYPDGLSGEQIPIGSRIVAVVDAYDAMTTSRPYRHTLGHERAEGVLREGAGSQWDPHVVERFLDTLAKHNEELRAA
jgi:putative nucleotidyltransferase with HDIG domain